MFAGSDDSYPAASKSSAVRRARLVRHKGFGSYGAPLCAHSFVSGAFEEDSTRIIYSMQNIRVRKELGRCMFVISIHAARIVALLHAFRIILVLAGQSYSVVRRDDTGLE